MGPMGLKVPSVLKGLKGLSVLKGPGFPNSLEALRDQRVPEIHWGPGALLGRLLPWRQGVPAYSNGRIARYRGTPRSL